MVTRDTFRAKISYINERKNILTKLLTKPTCLNIYKIVVDQTNTSYLNPKLQRIE